MDSLRRMAVGVAAVALLTGLLTARLHGEELTAGRSGEENTAVPGEDEYCDRDFDAYIDQLQGPSGFDSGEIPEVFSRDGCDCDVRMEEYIDRLDEAGFDPGDITEILLRGGCDITSVVVAMIKRFGNEAVVQIVSRAVYIAGPAAKGLVRSAAASVPGTDMTLVEQGLASGGVRDLLPEDDPGGFASEQ